MSNVVSFWNPKHYQVEDEMVGGIPVIVMEIPSGFYCVACAACDCHHISKVKRSVIKLELVTTQ